jgi:hypothetical protein
VTPSLECILTPIREGVLLVPFIPHHGHSHVHSAMKDPQHLLLKRLPTCMAQCISGRSMGMSINTLSWRGAILVMLSARQHRTLSMASLYF